MDRERKRIVLITGASSGIGAATARRFAAAGAEVILAGRSVEKLERLAAELANGSSAVSFDVGDELDVSKGVRTVLERYGRIDVLVNNAGFGVFATVEDTSLELAASMMNVNYMGMLRCTKAVLPSMLARREGHIVNIASIAGKLATAKTAAYAASKHAVVGFTNALRQELEGTGVTVTAIHPGPVHTPFFDTADPQGTYLQSVGRYMVTPERVAEEVFQAVERRKAEVHVPEWMGAGAKLGQLMPVSWMNALVGKFINRK